jgi:hypothetical protein
MTLVVALVTLALVASLILVFQFRPVGAPILALACSGLEALQTFRIVHISITRVPLGLVFAGGLLLAGAYVHYRSATKLMVTAATTVALVGALQLFMALR